ncbi:MAG: type II/IV secretion system ATPase subunit [Candidatus Woesearchaeota archaeon]|jgi:flagellar protein FlaI|nr:type II/IV secretion system ATPase subunit [Candidatus Woesearchaeota archaeon]
MDQKKLNQIMQKAKKSYSNNNVEFDKFLQNKSEFIPLNNLIAVQSQQGAVPNGGDPSLENGENEANQQNSQSLQNYNNQFGGNYGMQPNNFQQNMGSRINVIGDQGSGAPINIIAKNYINPDSIDDNDGLSEDLTKSTKSHQLSKIPDNMIKTSATDWEPLNYTGVDEKYKLYGLSYVEIKYDDVEQKIIYHVIEPELSEEELDVIAELKKAFIYVFEKVAFDNVGTNSRDIIINGTKKLCSKYKIKLTEEQFGKVVYYLERDFLGLEMIEPMMHDQFIEDISCDGLGIPIFINHLKYGPLEVSRKFTDLKKLNSFIVKLAQKSNQEVSLSRPILQGALTDGSRVEAIYGKEVSEKGSSFTIRKFRVEPFTPLHLMEFGTMPSFLLAYLWIAVENKKSLLISGGTATGKTTILNALSLFVPPTAKIVSIEDTPEINLPHEHWLPLISKEGNEKGQVTMFDLLKASLRERPDYIIVGEVRGAEAAILFQGMATGHAGLGTVHADKFNDLVNRMTIAPINLPKQLLTELDIVIFMKTVKVKDNVVRRVNSVVEIVDYETKKDHFLINEFVKYVPMEDVFSYKENSALISSLLESRGGEEDSIWAEIEKRRRILDFMSKNKILEFREVSHIIRAYYKDPKAIFEYMEGFVKEVEDETQK